MPQEKSKELKRQITGEITAQKKLIESLTESAKPVAPDNALGRLTRMEAINSQAVSENSLNAARAKLARLETALKNVDRPDFGLCIRCGNAIPAGRLLAMPENVLCVPCAEKREPRR